LHRQSAEFRGIYAQNRGQGLALQHSFAFSTALVFLFHVDRCSLQAYLENDWFPNYRLVAGRREDDMGQISFAVDKPALAGSQGKNILPFNARRRVPHVRLSPAIQPRSSEGVVVRLPLGAWESRQRARGMEKGVTKNRGDLSNNEMRFSPFDFVATAILILSLFSAPAVVWTLLKTASLG
jgi:hypothetical protein